jgi:hypothetical protein
MIFKFRDNFFKKKNRIRQTIPLGFTPSQRAAGHPRYEEAREIMRKNNPRVLEAWESTRAEKDEKERKEEEERRKMEEGNQRGSQEKLEAENQEPPKPSRLEFDWFADLPFELWRFVPFNGGIGKDQMRWLENELDEAWREKQYVIVCCHIPYQGELRDRTKLWDGEELAAMFRRKGKGCT